MLSSRAYWMIMHSLFLDQLISGPSFTKGRIYIGVNPPVSCGRLP